MANDAINVQRGYYEATSLKYDEMHPQDYDEHGFGLAYMLGMVEYLGVDSVLDVGCGTGFALLKIKERLPRVRAVGVEPSPHQRSAGYAKGLSETELLDGDAMSLVFDDASFGLVCEFGALHHIPRPGLAISEMLRVAQKAIFICDSNNFGQGNQVLCLCKQLINSVGLWSFADYIKTKGQRYTFSEGDGVSYSFSVFNHYKQIARECQSVHMINTSGGRPNLYRTASHVALLGLIRPKRNL